MVGSYVSTAIISFIGKRSAHLNIIQTFQAAGLHSPGAIRGWALTAVTLRLMFMARTSVTAALSPFFPPSDKLSEELAFPPAEACVPWLGFLISEAGWMGTGLCFRLRACRVWVWEEDVVATCWPRMARFWTWFLERMMGNYWQEKFQSGSEMCLLGNLWKWCFQCKPTKIVKSILVISQQ